MAFLDEIGRKISQTGQEAYSKTKEIADVVKYSSAISDEEKILARNYESLGKMYYNDSIGHSIPEMYTDIVQSISDSLKKIDDYQEYIKSLKGIKKCPNCGADVSNGASFCIKCGSRVVMEANIVCKNCGSTLPADASFCVYCGSKINSEESQFLESNESRCEKCGAIINDDDSFCTNCGAKIEKSVSNEVQIPETNDLYDTSEDSENVNREALAEPEVQVNQNVCKNCGAVTNDDDSFCTNCGAKIEKSVSKEVQIPETNDLSDTSEDPENVNREALAESEVTVNHNVCKNCGEPLEEGFLFCTNCGQRVE